VKGDRGEGPPAIRAIAASDLERVLTLAARSPEAAPWTRGDYERACRGDLDGWVAALGKNEERHLVGFLVARRMADEMEILNLAVEEALRRRGVASSLLEAALAFGRVRGARRVFLEVRASNAGAIAFYERQGFALAGRRPGYYADPPEHALVLSRELD
jgi:ribosomal-protein-alanine N-acetyltransferase